ncbi:hypothetical protein PAAG_12208 [Paracoccidioides lutzii Pb01]|uniref:Uncharacterized protein n=1 Tax=Paracoccidioides lutzii (strain ATCC MYA-826 / Pb01) TaxID=502779 RepID=A0A0A2V0Q4_PARBA|nr:hypothetical protein PAAG_12208 [Paracoccidioides lutzii Pb01]KGQ01083.1 hypothetical protein PAAG_12208 [Paracoccidioides lutzii Pb01]
MVLLYVQSIGGASSIVVGTGVLGDITTREERGGYTGLFFQAGQIDSIGNGSIPAVGVSKCPLDFVRQRLQDPSYTNGPASGARTRQDRKQRILFDWK